MKKKTLAIALAMSAFPVLTGCGSSNNNNGTPTNGYYGQGPYGTGGCVPLSQMIYFGGSGAQISYSGLMAGMIPGGPAAGTLNVSISPVPAQGGQTVTSVSAGSQMTMSIGTGYGGYPGYSGYPAAGGTLSGSLQLSPAIQQQIAYYNQGIGSYGTSMPGYSSFYGSYGSYPYGAQSQICVSGIALQGYLYQTVPAFAGTAYLYLNGTQHGWALPMN